jgi:hypothetical protein
VRFGASAPIAKARGWSQITAAASLSLAQLQPRQPLLRKYVPRRLKSHRSIKRADMEMRFSGPALVSHVNVDPDFAAKSPPRPKRRVERGYLALALDGTGRAISSGSTSAGASLDETTVRCLVLETHDLGRRLFDEVCGQGAEGGHGTIVDATIINAPSSTKNANEARNQEMQQTKNGQPRGIRHR